MCLMYRLTRQWTVEDEEEVEREKRRKERGSSTTADPDEEAEPQTSRYEINWRKIKREIHHHDAFRPCQEVYLALD